MKLFWKKWLLFAEKFGNFQMTILMMVIYIFLIPFYFIKLRFVDDSLRFRKPKSTNWINRKKIKNIKEYFSQQG